MYLIEFDDYYSNKRIGFSMGKDENFKRKNRKTINFNNHEVKALEKYYRKYRIDNQSKFLRETIMKTILKKFSDDYPTLWDQPGLSIQTVLRF
jgi:hypothetical protein